MADGVSITSGSGTTILTDDTGVGGHAQVMKLAISTDGSGTLIPADASNGLDVDVTRVTGTVTVDSELPAAAALADTAANPTAPAVGAAGLLYNGSTWDRARGDTTSGAWVNVKAGTITSSGSNSSPNVHRNITGATATLSSQTDQATSVQLLASNSARLGVTIVNDSTATLYLKFGTTASIAAGGYNYKLQPDDTLEMPSGGLPLYTGRIDGIWSSDASGWAAITEYT